MLMRTLPWMLAVALCSVSIDVWAAPGGLDTTLGETDAAAIAGEPGTFFDNDSLPTHPTAGGHPAEIHGQVTAGAAYSAGHGTATLEAARLNIRKALANDRSIALELDLAHYDGFDQARTAGPGP